MKAINLADKLATFSESSRHLTGVITMQLSIDSEFRALCREIAGENRSEEEWAEIESDDMFQSENYEGGYDATEEDFCFGYYAQDGQEYWFQLTLSEVNAIAAGENPVIEARPAES